MPVKAVNGCMVFTLFLVVSIRRTSHCRHKSNNNSYKSTDRDSEKERHKLPSLSSRSPAMHAVEVKSSRDKNRSNQAANTAQSTTPFEIGLVCHLCHLVDTICPCSSCPRCARLPVCLR